ncbi:hypothetical protein PACILC2_45530 [Paenibacillus cisolokensis]|uniref:Uncharacterized protein n=1 Tax=Paenibacillus cisolokensis TaxID=1658519 RepID=A0ABQ4NCL5_9BACL|nr:hypothetical protein [Paenibacillus cisolokensis]GIQ65985.1 hypothetical protein PACILC2_45530 [Paenibacillus cisolokensis]
MKQLHVLWIVLFSLLLLAAAGWGGLALYADQPVLPANTTVGELNIGGRPIDDALAALHALQKAAEEEWQGEIAVEDEEAKRWTIKELKLAAELETVRTALLRLREGSVWERAKYRYRFPRSFDLSFSFRRDLFEKSFKGEWGWTAKSEETATPAKAGAQTPEKHEVPSKGE